MTEVKASRVPLRQRQALETRRAIAQAARSLFAERGYAATSIEVVAAEAGVAERTVYAIFGTKKAILGAICEEWLSEAGVMQERGVRAMLEGAAASDADVAKMVAAWKNDRARSFRAVVTGLESSLRPGIDGDRAGAIIRALTSAEIYSELVAGEGWTPAEYEKWLAGLLAQVLLSPA